jgi:hypothetical protein
MLFLCLGPCPPSYQTYFQSKFLVNARLHLYTDLSSRLLLLQYCENLRYFKVFHHVKGLAFHVPKYHLVFVLTMRLIGSNHYHSHLLRTLFQQTYDHCTFEVLRNSMLEVKPLNPRV